MHQMIDLIAVLVTVLLTGTGIVPPDEFACEEGDVIEIGADEIGTLKNPAVRVS